MDMPEFSVSETHRLSSRPGSRLLSSSEGAGWRPIFASIQARTGFEGHFAPADDHLIVVQLRQRVRVRSRIGDFRQERMVIPGHVTLVPGGHAFSIKTPAQPSPYETLHIYLRRELVAQAQMQFCGSSGALMPCAAVMDSMIYGIACEIHKMLLHPAASDRHYINTLSGALAGYLARHHAIPAPRPARAGLTASQLDAALTYVETHLTHPITLAGIAAAAGVPAARLSRDFKHHTGTTPYDYVMRARAERAAALLRASGDSLSAVALACGFSDQQHMTHVIRRVFGATPGDIRRQH